MIGSSSTSSRSWGKAGVPGSAVSMDLAEVSWTGLTG
jgi:hypothetical protein